MEGVGGSAGWKIVVFLDRIYRIYWMGCLVLGDDINFWTLTSKVKYLFLMSSRIRGIEWSEAEFFVSFGY